MAIDEYEHLTDGQWQLYDLMSQISEDSYCADGPQFAPMAQWLAMVDERRTRAQRLAQMQ